MANIDAALKKRNQESISVVTPLFDELNQAWEKIENFFRSQGILQPAHFAYAKVYEFDHAQEPIGENLIAIEKLGGKWRICHGYFHYPAAEYGDWTPISECSVDRRVLLLDHVASLFESLVESNEKYVPEIEKAVAKSQSVLKSLGISE